MRRILITSLFVITTIMAFPMYSYAEIIEKLPQKDSTTLQYQDILMLFLLPHIDEEVEEYYSRLLTDNPTVYPYQIDVVKVERVNGFRGFHFKMILEVTPVVGPHIPVGKDRFIFEVAPTIHSTVKLIRFEHLKTYELPPNWSHIIRKS
jgi:hypothetical protein